RRATPRRAKPLASSPKDGLRECAAAQTKALAACNARDWGFLKDTASHMGESSPNHRSWILR
ncbi:MAG: hypothetical protein AAFO85_09950, partial [Cyanobacteria bacterium J06598_4]